MKAPGADSSDQPVPAHFAQGKMTNLVPSLHSWNVTSFSSFISYFPYGKQRFLGCVFNCSAAQDIHYPLSNAFLKHSLIQGFTTALWPYSIKTDENFQLKGTIRGSEIVFIIQEKLKTNKHIVNTDTAAKIN